MSEPTLEAMEVEIRNLSTCVADHSKALYGNGRPGLTYQMQEVAAIVRGLKDDADAARDRRRKIEVSVIIGVATAALTSLGSLALQAAVYLHRIAPPLLAVVALAGLSGCTYLNVETGRYLSVLQQKSLDLTLRADGSVEQVRYNAAADPAVAALATIAAGAAKDGTP